MRTFIRNKGTILWIIIFMLSATTQNAQDLFWVGNSGNWNDPTHWSLTSGGAGGAGTPNDETQVFFDEQSFTNFKQTVSIYGAVSCASLHASTSPEYAKLKVIDSAELSVHGDFGVGNNLNLDFDGDLIVTAYQTNYFNAGDNVFGGNVAFVGPGEVQLNSNLLVNKNDLSLNCDAFATNGYTVVSGGLNSIMNNTVDLEGSTVVFQKNINVSSNTQFIQGGTSAFKGYGVQTEDNTNLLVDFPLAAPVTCGTAPNEFTIDAFVVSDYNGQQVSCHGASDGEASVQVTGGIGPFVYTWIGGASPGSGINYSNLGPGTYTVLVTDAGQGVTCVSNVQITEPAAITVFSFNYTPPTCTGVCNGSGTPIVIGGVPNYTYSWTSGETTQFATQLCEGDNTMTVTDLNGCQFDSTFVIELDELFANVTITDIDCGGTNTGEAIANPIGGSGIYNYNWSTGDVSDQITGQIAGDYSLTVTDDNGCSVDTTFTILEQPPITIDLVAASDISCGGAADGEVDVTIAGGSTPYLIEWTGPNGFTSSNEDIANLEPGTYSLLVTDNIGCTQVFEAILDSPLAIVVDATVTSVACFGGNSGAIDVAITGGSSPYTIDWTGPNGFSSSNEDISGLVAGDYDITITDSQGCMYNETINVAEAPEIVIDITPNQPTCFGDLGSIDLSITGGTPPMSFSWIGPNGFTSTNEDISGLAIGDYDVTVTDASGCIQIGTTTLTEPLEIQVTETIIPLDCSGAPVAGIEIEITGGTSGYTTTWTGPSGFSSTDEDIYGLEAGTYSLELMDALGCLYQTDYTINLPAVMTVGGNATDISCFGFDNGNINLIISGGVAPITVNWVGPNGFVSSNEDLIALAQGTYDYTVTDALGCSVQGSFDILEPAALTVDATIQDILCNSLDDGAISIDVTGGTAPYSFGWTGPAGFVSFDEDISNLVAGTYNLVAVDDNGCNVFDSYVVSDVDAISVSNLKTNPSCYGATDGQIVLTITGGTTPYSITWSDNSSGLILADMPGGNYSVIVEDANGCGMQLSNLQLLEPDSISTLTSVTDVLCFGDNSGAIDVIASGGTPGFTFAWIGPNGFNSNQSNLNNLFAGDYLLTLTDANGCSINETVSVSEASEMIVDLTPDVLVCDGDLGNISSTVSGGTTPYTYDWSGPNGFASSTPNLTNVESGTYVLTVTDGAGCVVLESAELIAPNPMDVQSFITELDCSGDPIGSVELVVSGGVAPYTINWTSTNGFTSTDEDIFNLEEGTYDVTIQDANGCLFNDSFELTQPNLISVAAIVDDPLCFEEATGSIDITISGGTAPLTWTWTGPNGFTSPSQDIANLAAGDYTIQITDASGCVYSEVHTINETPALIADGSTTDALCNGDANGTASINITGGTAPYAINWTGPNGYTSVDEDIADLEAGDYNASIVDANGCSTSIDLTVGQPIAIVLDAVIVNSTCGSDIGQISVTTSGGVDPVTINWTDDLGNDLGNGMALVNLAAGLYTANVSDANGCIASFDYPVSDSDASDIASNVIDPLCAGDTNGAIDITVTGGVAPYAYDWTGPNAFTSTSEDIADLEAGAYTVLVTDSLGCVSSDIISVTDPTSITVTANITDIFCNGGNDGAIDITISGGTGALFVAWTGPNGFYMEQEDISGLEPGDYSVGISDDNGCSILELFSVIENTEISIDVLQSTPLCFGENQGWIDITLNGGTAPYIFDWNGPNGFMSSNEDLTALAPGIYDLNVSDAAGCSSTLQVEIIEWDVLALNLDITTPSCMVNNGLIQTNTTGGSGNYNYLWYDMQNGGAIISSAAFLDNIGAGVYLVEVIDDSGCASSEEVTLSDSDAIMNISVQNVACFGEANGTISIDISGGNPPFTYDWTGPNGFSSTAQNITDLLAGNYIISATDSLGCTINESVAVGEPDELMVDVLAGNVLCNGDTNGSFLTTISGGTAPYSFQWFYNSVIASTDQNPTGLQPGCYNLMVTDANLCTVSVDVCIDEPEALSIDALLTHNPCFGESVGTIDAAANGGSGGYIWLWNGPDSLVTNTPQLTGLKAGDYALTLTDINGCSMDTVIVITEGTPLDLETSITTPLCVGDVNGTIQLTVNGGSGVQDVSWSSDNGYAGNGLNISDLASGTYYYAILDSAGCTFSDSIVLQEPMGMEITVSSTPITCFGFSDASIAVEVMGGTPDYAYSWTGSNGFISDLQNVTALDTGVYTLTVLDLNGCIANWDTIVTQPVQLELLLDNVTQTSCEYTADGEIEISVIGGTPGYQILWTGSNGFSTSAEDITDLETGYYTTTVMDTLGCIAMIDSIAITSAVNIDVFTTEDITSCYGEGPHDLIGTQTGASLDYWTDIDGNTINIGGVLSVDPEPGIFEFVYVAEENGCMESDTVEVEIYELPFVDAGENQLIFIEELVEIGGMPTTESGNSILWTPNQQLSDSTAANPFAMELNEDITFYVMVTDGNGCWSQDSVFIEVIPEIDVNSGFSPNNDGMNDAWVIGHIQQYPNTNVQIYNRWGDVVFNSKGYAEPWDGNFNGNPLPIGTYYYLIEIDEPEFQEVLTGPVTILR